MHRQNRRTTVNNLHSIYFKELCHCAAPAFIHLAQFTDLPADPVLFPFCGLSGLTRIFFLYFAFISDDRQHTTSPSSLFTLFPVPCEPDVNREPVYTFTMKKFKDNIATCAMSRERHFSGIYLNGIVEN